MARSQVDLANLALGYLVRDTITSLDGGTPAAVQTKQNMAQAIEEVIEEFDWPECRVIAPLVLASGVDTAGWSFAYVLPSDAVKVWYVGTQTGADSVPFARGMSSDISSDRQYIFTNQGSAYIRYGSSRASVGRFTAQVFKLIALKLATLACMPLTKDLKLHKYLADTYKLDLSQVKTAVANSEPEIANIDFIPEAIAERSA